MKDDKTQTGAEGMKDYTAGKAWKIQKQRRIMEKAYELFSDRGIENVTMPEAAEASGVSRATLYRYFATKLDLVVAIGTWKWVEYIDMHNAMVTAQEYQAMTGAQFLEFYLDGFLDLYRRYPDLLCFNYNFNSFLRHEKGSAEQKAPYMGVVEKLGRQFHEKYERGQEDGTLQASITEEEMFSCCFHIMLASVTRYAVGLVYVSKKGMDPEKELVMLKELLLSRFTT